MKNTLLLSLLMALSWNVFAQDFYKVEHYVNEKYVYEAEGDYHYLLADKVNLRAKPTTDSEVIMNLPIGSELLLLKRSDSISVINNIQSNWYKVKVNQKTGWLWGGLIATYAFGSESDPSVKFVAGLEKRIEGKGGGWFIPVYQIRAFKNNQEIDKMSVKSFGRSFDNIQNIGRKGVENVDDILAFHVPCIGGCGCSTGEVYVFWNNNKFYNAGTTEGMADADYSFYEIFIFPSAIAGEAPYIIKKTGRVNEEKTREEKVVRQVITEYYLWNGTELYKTDKAKRVEDYEVSHD